MSEASRIRYKIAHELAQLCPPALGQEIVLTGSTSQGIADEASDIEQVFYVDAVPSLEEREIWLYEADATEIISDTEPIRDGSIWTTCCFRDIWIEAGWQAITLHEKNLQDILAGNIIDHRLLKLADIISHAVPLRSQGLLAKWQQELAHYPDGLPERLIADATELWMFPHTAAVRWALIRRGDLSSLAERLLRDIYNILRILFALNRRWEPEWKWIEYVSANLAIKPGRLVERINEVFSVPLLKRNVAVCMQLICDTLLLVPPQYDVTRALNTIRGDHIKMGGTYGKLSISFRANSFIDISGREQVRNADGQSCLHALP